MCPLAILLKKLSRLKQERNMHKSSPFTSEKKESKTVLNKYLSGFWCERTTGDGLFHRRKCYYGLWTHILARSDGLKLKWLNNGFFFITNKQLFASEDVNWWTGVVWSWIIEVFLSAVWIFILTAPIHCRGYIGEQVMRCSISSNLMKKQTTLHLEGEWALSKFSFLGELFRWCFLTYKQGFA